MCAVSVTELSAALPEITEVFSATNAAESLLDSRGSWIDTAEPVTRPSALKNFEL